MQREGFRSALLAAFSEVDNIVRVGLHGRQEYARRQERRQELIRSGQIKIVQVLSAFGRDFNIIAVTPDTRVAYFNVEDISRVYDLRNPNKKHMGVDDFLQMSAFMFREINEVHVHFNEKEIFLYHRLEDYLEVADAVFWTYKDKTMIKLKDGVEFKDMKREARAITINLGPGETFLGVNPKTLSQKDGDFTIIDRREFVKRFNLQPKEPLDLEEAEERYDLVIVVEEDGSVRVRNNTLLDSPENQIYVVTKLRPYI